MPHKNKYIEVNWNKNQKFSTTTDQNLNLHAECRRTDIFKKNIMNARIQFYSYLTNETVKLWQRVGRGVIFKKEAEILAVTANIVTLWMNICLN
jgi:hypothetical protein